MRRLLLAAAVAGAAITGGFAGTSQALCAGTALCAVSGCSGIVNTCPTAPECYGTVNACPAATRCSGGVNICDVRVA
jgi:hypothetical protein